MVQKQLHIWGVIIDRMMLGVIVGVIYLGLPTSSIKERIAD